MDGVNSVCILCGRACIRTDATAVPRRDNKKKHFAPFFYGSTPLHLHATTRCPRGRGLPSPLHTTTQREARRSNRLVVCSLRLRPRAQGARKATTAAGETAWYGRGVRCAVPSPRRVAGVDACVVPRLAPRGRSGERFVVAEGGDHDRRPPPLRLRIGA